MHDAQEQISRGPNRKYEQTTMMVGPFEAQKVDRVAFHFLINQKQLHLCSGLADTHFTVIRHWSQR